MSGKGQRQKSNKKRRRAPILAGPSLAERADRHDLYQRSVQDPDGDVGFLQIAWQDVRGASASPRHLREDFCGTALLSATWVTQGDDFTAEGFDIDAETLAWGEERNIRPLGSHAVRLTLHQKDVRDAGDRPADILCAQNFSYQIFRERAELVDYFRTARSHLSSGGIFVLDMYGGSEAIEELEEERDIDDGDFTYVWEQKAYHPGTGFTDCRIHFQFADGSEIRDAFIYHWRLYTPAELRDALREAGFREVHTYFEEFDDEGDGTGTFARDDAGVACEGWIGYMVAHD